LFLQRHQFTLTVDACITPGVLQEQQSQQARVFRFIRRQLAKQAAQANCLGTKIAPDQTVAASG
jgi:hypothetical protein